MKQILTKIKYNCLKLIETLTNNIILNADNDIVYRSKWLCNTNIKIWTNKIIFKQYSIKSKY